jgi:putative ABC transport system permease protein
MSPLRKLRAIVGLTIAHLSHERTRTVLAVLGITFAVLATTLLASVGYGVVETGQQKFDQSGRDLWVTGGPVRLAPGSVGGFQNSITDAHTVADEIGGRDDVQTAVPMAFQTVYVGTTADDLETLVGVGVTGSASRGAVQLTAGEGFTGGDRHYAGGSYDGPKSQEVIIGPRTAELLNISVGDTIHVGGTVADARANAVTVVGISPTFNRFLGAPTVVMPLSELQETTGTTRTDRATLVTVALTPDGDMTMVEQELQQAYPEYDVRTNREQLESVLAQQAVVLASGFVLVVLAVVAGAVLTVNLVALLVYHQQAELAAMKALGVSSRVLVGLAMAQGLALGLLGGALGLAVTPLAGGGLNVLAAHLVGFEGLVQTPTVVFGVGAVVAVGIGTLGALVAGWRVARLQPLATLDD